MKYENFSQAKYMVERIDELQKKRNDLDLSELRVNISTDGYYPLISIPVNDKQEPKPEYFEFGEAIVIRIKEDLDRRINNLKDSLEAL